jgi:hypothetical protein
MKGAEILKMTKEIQKQTIQKRRFRHQATTAYTQKETEPEPPLRKQISIPKNSDDGRSNDNNSLWFINSLVSLSIVYITGNCNHYDNVNAK